MISKYIILIYERSKPLFWVSGIQIKSIKQTIKWLGLRATARNEKTDTSNKP